MTETIYTSLANLVILAADRESLYIKLYLTGFRKNCAFLTIIYRRYYMAARGYEFYLRVLKVSLTSERYFQRIYFIDADEIPT